MTALHGLTDMSCFAYSTLKCFAYSTLNLAANGALMTYLDEKDEEMVLLSFAYVFNL